MSRSGEAFFTRDEAGRLWHHDSRGVRAALLVSEREVARVTYEYEYQAVDEDVRDWGAAWELVRSRARLPEPVPNTVTLAGARRSLPVLDEWLTNDKDVLRVVGTVRWLLSDHSVGADDELRTALLERLDRALAGLATPSAPTRVPDARDSCNFDGASRTARVNGAYKPSRA